MAANDGFTARWDPVGVTLTVTVLHEADKTPVNPATLTLGEKGGTPPRRVRRRERRLRL